MFSMLKILELGSITFLIQKKTQSGHNNANNALS